VAHLFFCIFPKISPNNTKPGKLNTTQDYLNNLKKQSSNIAGIVWDHYLNGLK
tara:strand:- start:348 stop:506 length:159 start_codon:yes stop_codon:yes gene_type:complete